MFLLYSVTSWFLLRNKGHVLIVDIFRLVVDY